MKSIALSFLVAAGLTLGAATALAETPAGSVVLTAAQEANREADAHARRATEFRVIARVETERAAQSMKIALDDEKLGFTYEAGVQRAKAVKHQMAAHIAMSNAAKEEKIAAEYRAKATQGLGQYKQVGAAVGANAQGTSSSVPR